MIFIFPIGDLFLVGCIVILLTGLFKALPDPQCPFGLTATMIVLPGLYIWWRFRWPIARIVHALGAAAVFIYMLIAGKDPEPEEDQWHE